MSKKRHSRNAKGTAPSIPSVRGYWNRTYPNDPRLLFTGWGLLFLGLILWFLADHFMWGGWIRTLINPVDMLLLGVGMVLVIITTLGIAQSG